MKRIIWLFILSAPLLLTAQQKGIQFSEGLSWDQIKEKAKSENKFIFVDCYATWCQPCKEMDKKIYIGERVGKSVNEKFISVKVQFDSTKKDAPEIKILYPAARFIEREFKITALPTYLFFTPDGEIIHRDIGVKPTNDFIAMVNDAQDPAKQFYSLLDKYKKDQLPLDILPALAKNVQMQTGNKELATGIAKKYMHEHLDKLGDEAFLTKEALFFVNDYKGLVSSNDKAFRIWKDYSQKIDTIIGFKGYAFQKIESVISDEIIEPALLLSRRENTEPDWQRLYKQIKKRYGKYHAYACITSSKAGWYYAKGDKQKYIHYTVMNLDHIGIAENVIADNMSLDRVNQMAWKVFLVSENKSDLKIALAWVDKCLSIIMSDTVLMNVLAAPVSDTKANILYKMGRKAEAIAIEERIADTKAFYKKTLNKMKNDEATWTSK